MPTLLTATGYDALREHHAQVGIKSQVGATIVARYSLNPDGVWDRRTNVRPRWKTASCSILVRRASLEPIAHDADRFRASMHNPDLMHQTRTHPAGTSES